MDIKEAITASIREFRQEKGIGYFKLSKMTGISARYLVTIEKNHTNISIDVFHKICTALDIPMNQIVIAAEKKLAESLN